MSDKEIKFKVSDQVVYPTHGVGEITGEETHTIGDMKIKMYVIVFRKDKMTLRVPVSRAIASGLRPLCTQADIEKVTVTLRGKARVKRGMWSRRAQEYEAKINSGSIIQLAEVVRDLYKNVDQEERSYSERMIYENALGRLAGEYAAVLQLDIKDATKKLMRQLEQQVREAEAA